MGEFVGRDRRTLSKYRAFLRCWLCQEVAEELGVMAFLGRRQEFGVRNSGVGGFRGGWEMMGGAQGALGKSCSRGFGERWNLFLKMSTLSVDG